jgi:hypothetical protein
MAKKRDVLRSKAGKKLYAVRDEEGQFADIQSYQKAHSSDLRKKSAAEVTSAAKKVKKAAKPAKAAKKKTKKKSAKRGK